MRLYYVDYVNHMIKTYVHHSIENISNTVDRTNWLTCDKVLQELPEQERLNVWNIYDRYTYKDPKPIPAIVKTYCDETSQNFEDVMNLVRRVTKRIKTERGL